MLMAEVEAGREVVTVVITLGIREDCEVVD